MPKWIRIGSMIDPNSPADQSNNSISINATGVYSAPPENGIIIKPIRDASGEAQANKAAVSVLGYTTPSGEIIQYRPFDGFGSSGGSSFPPGTIMPYGDVSDNFTFKTVGTGTPIVEPSGATGWLWCNGALLGSDAIYNDLKTLLSTTYGASGTLPDLRGRNIFGYGTNVAGGSSLTGSYPAAGFVGNNTAAVATVPSHTHMIPNHTHNITAHHHTMAESDQYYRYCNVQSGALGETVWMHAGDNDWGPKNIDSTDGKVDAVTSYYNDHWNPTWESRFGLGLPPFTEDSHDPFNTANAPTGGFHPYIPETIFLNFIIKY